MRKKFESAEQRAEARQAVAYMDDLLLTGTPEAKINFLRTANHDLLYCNPAPDGTAALLDNLILAYRDYLKSGL